MNKLIASLLVLSISVPVFAQSGTTGGFWGVGIGQAKAKFDGDNGSDTSKQLVLGYAPNDVVSFSIGKKDFGGVKDSFSYRHEFGSDYISGRGNSEVSAKGIPLTMDINMPVSDAFAFRLQLGFVRWDARDKGSYFFEDRFNGQVYRDSGTFNSKVADGTDKFYGVGFTTKFESTEFLFGVTNYKLDELKVREIQLMFKFF